MRSDNAPPEQRRGGWRLAGFAGLMAITAAGAAHAAARHKPANAAPAASSLHARALAALPAARAAFDKEMIDYPSARFQEVHGRIVKSVYASDDGQSDKVPWTHRGGPILVLCGEVNGKNHMGGYTGWTPFAFEPAQTDMVTLYGYENPTRLPHQVNAASEASLRIVDEDGHDEEEVRDLCTGEPIEADTSDLSGGLQPKGGRQ